MKYIKKFNEELNTETYLKAADKLSYNHPDRSKKLKDYANSKLNTYTIISDRFEGDLKVKIGKIYNTMIMLDVVEDLRWIEDYSNNISSITVTEDGLRYGFELINKCYCINREEAFKLHNELLKFNMNVPVNKLYTTRDLKKDYEYKNKNISKKFDLLGDRTHQKQKIVKELWNLAGYKDATGNELRLPTKDDFSIFNKKAAKKLMMDLFDGEIPPYIW